MIRKLLTPLAFTLAVLIGWHSACAQMAGERGTGYVNMQRPVNWDSPLNRGLVSWWVVLPDTNRGAVTWRDIAGTNHGTLTGMDPATDWVGSTRPGGLGSLDFDGSNDYVTCGTGSATKYAWTSSNSISVCGWYRATAVQRSSILGIGGDANTWRINILSTSKLCFSIATEGSTTSDYTVVNGTTFHFMAVASRSENKVKIFVNGAEQTYSAQDTSLPTSTTNPTVLIIGALPVNTSAHLLSGRLDDVRLFLDDKSNQAQQIFLDSLAGNPQTLNWIDYGGEYYEDAAPGGVGTPYYYQAKAARDQRDRDKFFAAIGQPSDTHWGLSP